MSYLDDLLKNASSDWQNLPGQGKPLNLDENPHTPETMRMAYKILKDNDLAPAWIMEGKEIDNAREKLIGQIRRRPEQSSLKQSLQDAVTAFNKRVLSYNLKVPQGIEHKRMIDVASELKRS